MSTDDAAGGGAVASNFISKTFQMLQDDSNRDAVRWGRAGASLIIDLVSVSVLRVAVALVTQFQRGDAPVCAHTCRTPCAQR
jgi:hypothetical protein